MAVHFHPLKVKNIRRETQDCVSVAFDIPDGLSEHFQYKHGQNVTLKAMIGNEEIRRTYSICSSPFENELRIAIKKAANGLFSTYINEQLKEGDVLNVLPPTGKFTNEVNKENKKRYIAFAAGSGITPILSIIKTSLQTEPESSFTLVYGNRNRSSIIFLEELQGLKNKYIERFHFINILSREKTDTSINSGRIDNEKLNELKRLIDYKNFDEYFICGPAEMITSIKDFLLQADIDKRKIHFELFVVPGEKKKTITQTFITKDESQQSNIVIKADGIAFDFNVPFDGINILDAALQHGADLPFACKGGVCCSCKAKLVEGEVLMDNNYALEPEEIEQGFILCCQSHPVTQKVVIDFDIK